MTSLPSFQVPLSVASPSCELLPPVTFSPSTLSVSRNGNGCPFASATASHWPLRLRAPAGAAAAAGAAPTTGITFLSSGGIFFPPFPASALLVSPSPLRVVFGVEDKREPSILKLSIGDRDLLVTVLRKTRNLAAFAFEFKREFLLRTVRRLHHSFVCAGHIRILRKSKNAAEQERERQ